MLLPSPEASSFISGISRQTCLLKRCAPQAHSKISIHLLLHAGLTTLRSLPGHSRSSMTTLAPEMLLETQSLVRTSSLQRMAQKSCLPCSTTLPFLFLPWVDTQSKSPPLTQDQLPALRSLTSMTVALRACWKMFRQASSDLTANFDQDGLVMDSLLSESVHGFY